MKFDLSNLNPGVWFQFKDDKAQVCLRTLSTEDSQKIKEQCSKKRYEYRNEKQFVIEDVNEKIMLELIWDICIVDWKEIYDAEDKPIPCTKEMKILLMSRCIEFAEFVIKHLGKVKELKDKQTEDERKNSLTS